MKSARSACPSFFLALLLGFSAPSVSQTAGNSPVRAGSGQSEAEFVPGKPLRRSLKGREVHAYPLKLESGQYVDATVEQLEVGVVLRLIGPDDKPAAESSGFLNVQVTERIQFVASVGGTYRLEVVASENDEVPGLYELNVKPLHAPTEAEREAARASELECRAFGLWHARKGAEALPLFEQALTIREKSSGPETREFGDTLSALALLNIRRADFAKAEPLAKRSRDVREKVLGQTHPDFLLSLDTLADLYENKADYAEAEKYRLRVLELREKTLGPEHPDTATSLNNLANLYRDTGDYAKAESCFLRVLAVYEKTLGPNHREVATTTNNLGLLYHSKGDYAKAEALHHRSMAIREKLYGTDHPDYALSLNNLAWLYTETGDYPKAQSHYLRTLAILEKSLGPTHPVAALVLTNLAAVYQNQGKYAEAETVLRKALDIREKVLGPEHPATAVTLNNLGRLYQQKGDLDKAEDFLQRSLAASEKKLGPNHREVAVTLNNLGLTYLNKREFDKAEQMLQRAVSVFEKALGPEHREVANALHNLAVLYRDKGDPARAEPLLRRAIAITEKALGPEYPLAAGYTNQLAVTQTAQGKYVEAEPLFQRATVILEKTIGPESPMTAQTLSNWATMYQAAGRFSDALSIRTWANEARERDLARNLVSGSERQKLAYLNLSADEKDQTLTLHLQHLADNADAGRMALSVVLSRKGRALDAMTDAIAAVRKHATPEDQQLLDELADEKSKLSQLTLRGPGKEGLEQYRAALKEQQSKVDDLESKVGLRNAEYRARTRPVTLAAVQREIPPDMVLIEFAAYRPFDAKSRTFGASRYAVYALGAEGNPTWADLGDAEAIDRLVNRFRAVVRDKTADVAKRVKPAARELDKLVMAPVRNLIGDKRRLFLSPDGLLNLVPFAALVDEHGRFLIERYSFSYLTSGRDLLRLRIKDDSPRPAVVLAAPDFGRAPAPTNDKSLRTEMLPGFFTSLPGTEQEARELHRLFPSAEILTRQAATETAVKSLAGPRLLHIATHGFFLANESPKAGVLLPSASDESTRNLVRLEVVGDELIADPLLRSGLGLAGANARKSGNDDGILTALEAAGLDLRGTKLVVLSACDTGVGEVKNGEGVYGLRRALFLAGSESQVMSLWPVSDAGTRDLMVGYYRRLLAGEGLTEALRNVQLRMLKDPQRRRPFYWASFIQSGEWANLDGKR